MSRAMRRDLPPTTVPDPQACARRSGLTKLLLALCVRFQHCRGLNPLHSAVTMRRVAFRLGLACLLAVACSAMMVAATESSTSEALQLTPELDAEYNLQPLTHSEEQDVEMELQELGVRTHKSVLHAAKRAATRVRAERSTDGFVCLLFGCALLLLR